MQLGPWGLVHHQKACTLKIDYVNNGRLHTKIMYNSLQILINQ